MKKLICVVFLASALTYAGELSDSQMAKFFEFSKQEKYTEAVTAILEYVLTYREQPMVLASETTRLSGIVKQFFMQHGKPLSYTMWKRRSLSKNWDQTVYQINCEKSAWMVELREYIGADGSRSFNEFRYVTEEDIFKAYAK